MSPECLYDTSSKVNNTSLDFFAVINGISVIERIIKTSYRNTRLSKMHQVQMLEVNSLALYGALSLRYSEVGSSPHILIQETCLKTLLSGETGLPQLHGFCIPVKDVLLKYCHKHFDEVFQKVVEHIEITADMILNNDLLSQEEKLSNDRGRFKKAFALSVFLCCNAVSFSVAGNDMDVREYKNGNLLPSLPLQGNVRKLVAELRRIVDQRLLPSYMERNFSLAVQPCTFLDLLNASSDNDKFIECKVKLRGTDAVEVCSYESVRSALFLKNVAFDENADVFKQWTKSKSFLEEFERTKMLTIQDEDEQGKKSEESNALRKITGLIKRRIDPVAFAAAIVRFKHMKASFRHFFRVLLERIAAKKTDTEQVGHLQEDEHDKENETIYLALEDIRNPFNERGQFRTRQEHIKANFLGNTVIDSIECSCCGCILTPDPNIQNIRFQEYNRQGRTVQYQQFAQHYNMSMFGNGLGNHYDMGEVFQFHVRLPIHNDNYYQFTQSLDNLAAVIARLAMSQELLGNIIQRCSAKSSDSTIISGWYLNTVEEAQIHLISISDAINNLHRSVHEWSMYPLNPQSQGVWSIMQSASSLPQHIESFFTQKRIEEADLKRKNQTTLLDPGEDETDDNPILELISGPYLNPDAAVFVPRF